MLETKKNPRQTEKEKSGGVKMKFRLTGEFGELSLVRNNKPHSGIDLALPEGTQLRSIMDGVVEKVVNYGDANIGKGVIVRLDNGDRAIYGHMSEITVHKGQHVDAGQLIGLSGNTGNSTGPHLHFGLTDANGAIIDPTKYAEDLAAISGDVSDMSVFNDHLRHIIGIFKDNGSVDKYHQADKHYFLDYIWDKFQDGCIYIGEAFLHNLPDIMGYGTILAGALVILGAMIGKGKMMKVLSIYGGSLIVAILLRIS